MKEARTQMYEENKTTWGRMEKGGVYGEEQPSNDNSKKGGSYRVARFAGGERA